MNLQLAEKSDAAYLAKLRRDIHARPSDVSLRYEYASLADRLSFFDEARSSYLSILQIERGNFGALNNLGVLYFSRKHYQTARKVYQILVSRHPSSALAHKNLADVLLALRCYEEAHSEYENALRHDPAMQGVHQGLGYVFDQLGLADSAREHRQADFKMHPVMKLPFRGLGSPTRLLVIASVDVANVPTAIWMDRDLFDAHVIVASAYSERELPPHEVVFCTIGEADKCATDLVAAEALLKRTTAPIINHPLLVGMTGRESNARRFAGIDRVVSPPIRMFDRTDLLSVNAFRIVEASGLTWPLLLREPGMHMGEQLLFVESPHDFSAAAEQLTGDKLFAIQYIDTRGADGMFRKYRVMFVDGELYPVHLAISQSWKVHYFSANMNDSAEYRAEEELFLNDMPGTLGEPGYSALQRIRDIVGLDYAGVDFGIDRFGNIVLFEVNATMNAGLPPPDAHWRYRLAPIKRLRTAVRNMIVSRAKQTREVSQAQATIDGGEPLSLDELAVPKVLTENIIRAANEEFGEALVAIAVSGSRVKGNACSSSDLDVHIIHRGAWYQKRLIGSPHSLFGIAIDLTVNPLDQLILWVARHRAFADFYTNAQILYPRPIPEEMSYVLGLARRSMALPPVETRESEDHHWIYHDLRRIIDHTIEENEADQRASVAHLLSNIASLRLSLAGAHHIRNYRLVTQLREIDPVFASRYEACLSMSAPGQCIETASELLESMKPQNGSFVGEKK